MLTRAIPVQAHRTEAAALAAMQHFSSEGVVGRTLIERGNPGTFDDVKHGIKLASTSDMAALSGNGAVPMQIAEFKQG